MSQSINILLIVSCNNHKSTEFTNKLKIQFISITKGNHTNFSNGFTIKFKSHKITQPSKNTFHQPENTTASGNLSVFNINCIKYKIDEFNNIDNNIFINL